MDKLVLDNVDGWERNAYSNPQVFGLELLDEFSYDNESYQFDIRAVWRDAQGRVWTARDSGCSCPAPFERTTELDRVWNFDDLQEEYRAAVAYIKEHEYGSMGSPERFEAFKTAVKGALAALKAGSEPLTRLEQIKKEVGL
jgi:hypothetical protein